MERIILASQSPRRRELIKLISDNVICVSAKDEELVPEGMAPADIPAHLALLKARSVRSDYPNDIIIGSDTVVIYEDSLLLKPTDKEDALRMLTFLGGKTHRVITGCAIIKGERELTFSEETQVEFYPLSERDILGYIETGEPMDKAGAYGIQGRGSLLVKGIKGDYFNVVGLPVASLKRYLDKFMENE